jgi:hypothetical protein
MIHTRIFVLVDQSDAESFSDELRRRGFDARESESGIADAAVVDLGLAVLDGWKGDALLDPNELRERPCVIAVEGTGLRRLKPVAPSGLLTALRNRTAM